MYTRGSEINCSAECVDILLGHDRQTPVRSAFHSAFKIISEVWVVQSRRNMQDFAMRKGWDLLRLWIDSWEVDAADQIQSHTSKRGSARTLIARDSVYRDARLSDTATRIEALPPVLRESGSFLLTPRERQCSRAKRIVSLKRLSTVVTKHALVTPCMSYELETFQEQATYEQ